MCEKQRTTEMHLTVFLCFLYNVQIRELIYDTVIPSSSKQLNSTKRSINEDNALRFPWYDIVATYIFDCSSAHPCEFVQLTTYIRCYTSKFVSS